MKKFLAVFDGYKMSKSTLEYAVQITRRAGAQLVGVFLDEAIYRSYNLYKVLTSYENSEEVIKQLDERDRQKREDAASLFQKTCDKNGVKFSIHRDKGIAIQELKHESMFADLIIIHKTETFSNSREKPPTRFIRDLLTDVQCPVLLVPANYTNVKKVTMLYDAGPSSVYAIKMFSYLFNGVMDLPVEVFTVNENMSSPRLPDNKLIREFMKRHFPSADFKILKGVAEEQILGHLRLHKGSELVVLGAYRRTEISRWFKISMADILMKETDIPLFIAHN